MDSRTIDRIMRGNPVTRPHYSGCSPCDILPRPTQFPTAIVANLDPASMPGSHWVAIYIASPEKAYYFCPFGDPPRGNLLRYMSQFSDVTRNVCKFQPLDSLNCGYFAMYVLYQLCLGFSFPHVLSLLSQSHNADLMVELFIKKLIK